MHLFRFLSITCECSLESVAVLKLSRLIAPLCLCSRASYATSWASLVTCFVVEGVSLLVLRKGIHKIDCNIWYNPLLVFQGICTFLHTKQQFQLNGQKLLVIAHRLGNAITQYLVDPSLSRCKHVLHLLSKYGAGAEWHEVNLASGSLPIESLSVKSLSRV